MITIEEALQIIATQQVKPQAERRELKDCLGYSLKQEIRSGFELPSFDNSAMDGYAVCGIAMEYELVGEVAAGDRDLPELRPGEAVRIFTGAKLPDNSTAVVMQEKTRRKGNRLLLDQEPKPGQSIRKKGEELKKGQVVFEEGYSLSPAGIGMLASLGLDKVEVFRKPCIHLITTGNELIRPGEKKQVGQIFESNSFTLAAACEQYGFSCKNITQIGDDFEAIKAGIRISLESADVLLLSGGISVGDYDFVKQALEENGVEEQFYKVFQKPGKPLYFGRKADKFVFALPGNPASSLSCFYIYVLPLLYRLSGSGKSGLERLPLAISHDHENRSDRPSFLKARIADGKVSILSGQGSSMIQSMSLGNALVLMDAGMLVKKGELVECILI